MSNDEANSFLSLEILIFSILFRNHIKKTFIYLLPVSVVKLRPRCSTALKSLVEQTDTSKYVVQARY